MSRNRYVHLVGFALEHPWAITAPMLRIVATILGERLAGLPADPLAIETALAARKPDGPQPIRGSIGIIPMYGVLAPRINLLSESSGGTSFERLTAQLREMVARDDVKTIVFDVDSPGGSVAGAAEFAAEVRAARAKKPIIAVANHTMASAAYWVMANATKVHASPSAAVGSIGVFTIHHDLSEAMTKFGVKRTLIAAGKYKIEGYEGEPLTEEAIAYRTVLITKAYDRFTSDVAKGRSVPQSTVKSGYGEGRTVTADDALDLGMVDKVATLDETLERLLPPGAAVIEPTHALSGATTPQEPSPATGQESHADIHWQLAIERQLLDCSL